MTRVPAGSALAVDREIFARALTAAVEALSDVRLSAGKFKKFHSGMVILASGPLTSPALAQAVASLLGQEYLYFYDAISPIVTAESIDMDIAFRASRYDRDGDDYLNLPLTRQEYYAFVDALVKADRVPTHSFERFVPFEGCMPIEEMADRGKDTLAFGPMRAVGLDRSTHRQAPIRGGPIASGESR